MKDARMPPSRTSKNGLSGAVSIGREALRVHSKRAESD